MTPISFDELVETLKQRLSSQLVIGISGFGGAGKSTVAGQLAKAMDSAQVVSADDFLINRLQNRDDSWNDVDRARILREVLEPFRKGEEIHYRRYDWLTNQPGEWRTLPQSARLVLEGIGILHPDLAPSFDVTVWIDVPIEVAGKRGKYRDREIYKLDNDRFWNDVWIPNDLDYIERYRPHENADYLLVT